MYCSKCGMSIDDNAEKCTNCGNEIKKVTADSSFARWVVLGFFIPIVGLILFLIHHKDKPMRAKSSGVGALLGLVVSMLITVVSVVVVFIGIDAYTRALEKVTTVPESIETIDEANETVKSFVGEDTYNQAVESITEELEKYKIVDDINDILINYADVKFDSFDINKKNGNYDTKLIVSVTNRDERQRSYYITIEAVDYNGVRIGTDMVMVNKLNSGQTIKLEAFRSIEQDKIEQYKKSKFKVLDIQMF